MKSKFRYSIVIPTRNASQYAIGAAQLVLNEGRRDVEVIISDNHSHQAHQRALHAFVSGSAGDSIRLVTPPSPCSMTDNFEFALSASSGEWISVIGSDDGICPSFFSRLDKVLEDNPDVSLIAAKKSGYAWPGCESFLGDVAISYSSGRRIRRKGTHFRYFRIWSGIGSYENLPIAYTGGVFSRTIFEEIRRNQGGRFYASVAPDVYSAATFLLFSNDFLSMNDSLFWSGASPVSNGLTTQGVVDSSVTSTSTFATESAVDGWSVPSRVSISSGSSLIALCYDAAYRSACHHSRLQKRILESNLAVEWVLGAMQREAMDLKSPHQVAERLRDIDLHTTYGLLAWLVRSFSRTCVPPANLVLAKIGSAKRYLLRRISPNSNFLVLRDARNAFCNIQAASDYLTSRAL